MTLGFPLHDEDISMRKLVDWLLCRKLRVKRTIRVPAISSKLADIPPDDFSWRKYGQKPIKGSPHPRYISLTSFGQCSLNITETKMVYHQISD